MNQAALDRVWYGDRAPGPLLGALERVYRGVSARRRAKERQQQAEDLVGKPIIVVGNITAGGTGKSPLVVRLCELLRGAGLAVAVVSRGYGREGRAPVRVDAATSPREGGDEPAMIARRAGVTVYVDRDREAAARQAFGEGADVVIADDGLQRLRLPRIMELCVVDGDRGFGNGRLLPAGPLREPVERLDTVDWVVVNGRGEFGGNIRQKRVDMSLEPQGFFALDSDQQLAVCEAADRLQERAASAVTAIGNPGRFFDTLASLGIETDVKRRFNDHHAFTRSDFEGLEGAILMTEKDAVKCAGLGLDNAWYLKVGARLPEQWEAQLLTTILGHLDHPSERQGNA
ncbi:tetraacyldisaccharide 4'-kinase [Marinihelvus fidelis]|uniref:Tetraacyldisaccharide 4'-kinase n=1 Tax=Marinihelvus fidelis TaxID=2613842 RepID=A0A5N0TAC1_9GAMM|nr:tetraacyldisaccharide 4'-kinase [Marinihelvus fidelis]KAA9131945.1 tetraacyldisaccharide 4'-kinase [Marinihelvus fidelis]